MGRQKPDQGEPGRRLKDFGFCSDFLLKVFLWLRGGETIRQGRNQGELLGEGFGNLGERG